MYARRYTGVIPSEFYSLHRTTSSYISVQVEIAA